MSILGSILQVSAFKHLSNKLFTCYTNRFQSYQKKKKAKAWKYIFDTSSIILAKHSIKTKLHSSLIYNFKMEKSFKFSSKIQLVVHLKTKIP